MRGTLHNLPEPPLPDGWAASTLFADAWVRMVPNWRPLREGEEPDLLRVELDDRERCTTYCWRFGRPGSVDDAGFADTLRDAIAACERAYCGCYVGAVVGQDGAARQ